MANTREKTRVKTSEKKSDGNRSTRSSRSSRSSRHKRSNKTSNKITKAIKSKLLTFGKWIKRTFKKSPLKFILVIVFVVAGSYLIITNAFRFHDRIETGDYTHAEKFDNYLIIEGIDVSYAQGDIDWKAVKNSGVDFAFIRAGYRSTDKGSLNVDEYFYDNVKKAEDAGVMVGLYYFSQAITAKEAQEEAEALIDLAKDYDVQLPLVMDYEKADGGRLSNAISNGDISVWDLNQIAATFTNVVEKAGYESMVYANYDFLQNYLDGEWLDDYTNIWGAQYNTSAQFTCNYQFWQCSDSWTVPGIEGNVDHNFWYFDKANGWASVGGTDSEDRTSISDLNVSVKDNAVKYIGFAKEPGVKVKKGWRRLWNNFSYKTAYVHNTKEGTGYAIVQGIGKYKGMIAVPFEIS